MSKQNNFKTKKIKPYLSLTYIPVYNRHIVVFFSDTIGNIADELEKPANAGVKKWLLEKTGGTISTSDSYGYVSYGLNDIPVIIAISTKTRRFFGITFTIVHECTHVVDSFSRIIGCTNEDEFRAHMMEHIVCDIVEQFQNFYKVTLINSN